MRFSGRDYPHMRTFKSLGDARKFAENQRRRGRLARVLKSAGKGPIEGHHLVFYT